MIDINNPGTVFTFCAIIGLLLWSAFVTGMNEAKGKASPTCIPFVVAVAPISIIGVAALVSMTIKTILHQ